MSVKVPECLKNDFRLSRVAEQATIIFGPFLKGIGENVSISNFFYFSAVLEKISWVFSWCCEVLLNYQKC